MSFNSPIGLISTTPTPLDMSNRLGLPAPTASEVGPTNAAAAVLKSKHSADAQHAPTSKTAGDQIIRSAPQSPNLYDAARNLGLTAEGQHPSTGSAVTAATTGIASRAAGSAIANGASAAGQAVVRATIGVSEAVGSAVSFPAVVGTAAVGAGIAAVRSPAGNASESDPNAAWRSSSPAASDRLEIQKYPHVDSHSLDAGRAAMADFNQCHPDDMNNLASGGFKTFTGRSDLASSALKNTLGNVPTDASGKPYKVHHLVEQVRTSQFGTQAIQNTANTIALPDSVHDKISGYYNSKAVRSKIKNLDGTPAQGRVRDHVGKMSYAEQRQFGINTTRRFLTEDTTLSVGAKNKIFKELDDLQQVRPKDPTSCFAEVK